MPFRKEDIFASNLSKNKLLKNIRQHSEDEKKEIYIEISSRVRDSISGGILKDVQHLYSVIEHINKASVFSNLLHSSDEKLTKALKNASIIVLACRYDKVNILNWAFSDEKILKTFGTFIGKELILPTDEDDGGHDAFYYAVRSNNTELLDVLINKWANNYVDLRTPDLEFLLSSAFETVKLNNISVSHKMEYVIGEQLLSMRFVTSSGSGNISIKNILERIDLVIESFEILKSKYSEKDVDEKFLYIAKFIAENIHTLKRQLRSTYKTLPWEEIEFCLTIFISSIINKNEFSMYCKAVLNKTRILHHLENFFSRLTIEKANIKPAIINQINKLPNQNRSTVVDTIIKSNHLFEDLYKDYIIIRDIHSLQKIDDCLTVAVQIDCTKNEGRMLIMRTLQITGEHLKNTLESPKLSSVTSDFLISLLPGNTKKILTNLRDSLSHAISLDKRNNVDDANYFKSIQNDLKLLKDVILDIICKEKLKPIVKILEKLISSDCSEEISAIIDIFAGIDYKSLKFPKGSNVKEEIQKFSSEVSSQLEMAEYEKRLLLKLNDIVNKDGSKLAISSSNYSFAFASLLSACNSAYLQNFSDPSTIKNAKYLAGCVLNAISIIEVKTKKEILDILFEIYSCLKTKKVEENIDKILVDWHLLILNIQGDVSELSGIHDLSVKFNSTKNSTETNNVSNSNNKDQLENRQCLLKEFLTEKKLLNKTITDKEISLYMSTVEWQLIMEMLFLDLLSALQAAKVKFAHNLNFFDTYTPVLNGNWLRNHLAHFNNIVEVQHFNSSLAILLNARKFVDHEWSKKNIIGKPVNNISSLKSKFYTGLNKLDTKISMFEACEKGNMEKLILLSEKGADTYSRNLKNISALHYASKSSNLSLVKYVFENTVDSEYKDIDGNTPLHVAATFGSSDIVNYFLTNKIFDANEVNNRLDTPLHVAALSGCKGNIEIILKYAKDIYLKNIAGLAAIHLASIKNQIEIVKCLLKNNVNVNSVSKGGLTPLHLAAENGHVKLVKFLIEKGAKINAKNDYGGIPLHTSALDGHVKVVKLLLANGSNINDQVFDGYTALQNAVESGHEEIVKILLEKGANANLAKVANNYVPLHRAASDGNVNIATLLLENGAHVNTTTSEGLTPLHYASLAGHLHVVKLLLKFGAYIDSKIRGNVSALQLAVSENHTEVVKYLIDKGAVVNCMDANGFSPLHFSIQKSNIKLINLLIKNGADINAKTYSGITPLHLSLQFGLKSVFKTLISHKVDIHCKCSGNGWNCLHFAATFDGNSDIIENLVSLGFQIDSKDNDNNTPLHIASTFGNCQIVKLLLKLNASIDCKQSNGFTPLHIAIDKNHQKLVEILLNSGANVNIKNDKFCEFNPISLAIKNKNFDMVKLLLNKGCDINSDDAKTLYFSVAIGNKEMVDILINNSVIYSKCLNKALALAVVKGYNNIVEALILKGANIDSLSIDENLKGFGALHLASKFGFSDITKTLIDYGAQVDIKTIEGGNTPLQIAIRHDYSEVVKTLITSGKANILAKDFDNRTAIEFAVGHGRFEIVKFLLPHVIAHINDKGNTDFTLLHIAAQTGNSRVTEFLINNGADLNAKNTLGSKPFHIAAREGNVEDLELFIKSGNLVNDLGAAGFNLAHYAAVEGHIDVLKVLINKNIDLNAVDLRGWRPLNYSVERGFREFTEILIENGAFYDVFDQMKCKLITNPISNQVMKLINATDNLFNATKLNDSKKVEQYIKEGAFVNGRKRNGDTVLGYSSWKGFYEIVNILLQNNANPNIIGKGDSSPLHYASKFGRVNIVLALLSHGAIYNFENKSGKIPLDFASDKEVISILELIDSVFRRVEKHDIKVLQQLKGIKSDLMDAVIGCRNKGKEFLLGVAVALKFPKLNDLQSIFDSKESFEISCAEDLIRQEKYIEAMKIYKNIVIKREKIWGPNHPLTLEVKSSVASMYYKTGNYFEALKIYENVYQKQSQIFGLNDKLSLRTRSLIAHVLHCMGKVDKALGIFREVYAAQAEICGEDDSDTLITRFHMALSLNDLRKFDEALMHNFEVYKIRKRTLGPYHLSTLTSYNNYAMVLNNKGDYVEALRIFKEVYEAKKKIFGATHSETLRTAQLIGIILNEHDDVEGLRLSERTYELQKQKLGPDHPETLITKYNIGNYHYVNGNTNEAFKIFSELLPKCKQVFGINHETVKRTEEALEILKKKYHFIGFDPYKTAQNSANILHSAANKGSIITLENLLKNGYDANERDSEGRTALHFAVNMGHEKAVNTLLKYGANPTLSTKKGNTILHTAVLKNNKQIAKILLMNTKKVYPQKFHDFINAKTHSSHTTALQIAAKRGSEELANLLLSFGAV